MIPFFFLLFSFLSCQSAPRTAISLGGYLPLEPGGYVYLIAEQDALPVLNQFMFNDINDKQFQQMVDQTRFTVAAAYVTPASHYRLAAWGNYPDSRAKMAFGSSKEWKKRRSIISGADYWHSSPRGLSVALTGEMALVATAPGDEDAPDPFFTAPGTAMPEGFDAFREGSILACWLDSPGPAISKKLEELGIPLELPAEQLFISLFPVEDRQYTARLQIQLPGESQARALTMMFAIVRNFVPSQSVMGMLFANPPEQDGKNLNITTAPLSDHEIALLLKLFSL